MKSLLFAKGGLIINLCSWIPNKYAHVQLPKVYTHIDLFLDEKETNLHNTSPYTFTSYTEVNPPPPPPLADIAGFGVIETLLKDYSTHFCECTTIKIKDFCVMSWDGSNTLYTIHKATHTISSLAITFFFFSKTNVKSFHLTWQCCFQWGWATRNVRSQFAPSCRPSTTQRAQPRRPYQMHSGWWRPPITGHCLAGLR